VLRPLVCTVAVLTLTACGGENRAFPYTDLTDKVGALEFTHITTRHFDNREELVEVLRRNNPGRRIRLPAIDFSRESVYLVAAGPRSSTGYELRVERVRDEGTRVVIAVREHAPKLSDRVAARVTYPFLLLSLPRTDEPVKLKWLGRP
jgi:PrcB C-terminal